MIGIGGWIAALIIGVVLLVVAPHVPPPASRIMHIIGIVLLVIALVLFILWLLGAVLGVAALNAAGAVVGGVAV